MKEPEDVGPLRLAYDLHRDSALTPAGTVAFPRTCRRIAPGRHCPHQRNHRAYEVVLRNIATVSLVARNRRGYGAKARHTLQGEHVVGRLGS